MWPRTDEERARKRNCGFVSFWRRQDAVNAKRAMQDVEVESADMECSYFCRVVFESVLCFVDLCGRFY